MKVTTVLKLPDGSMKVRDGEFGVTICGRLEGEELVCETEYAATPNQARALTVMALHWLNDTYPDMFTKALATFFIESGQMPADAEGLFLKFKKIP